MPLSVPAYYGSGLGGLPDSGTLGLPQTGARGVCGTELSPADRAKQMARRKAIYLELRPETAHGANREGAGVAKLSTPKVERFSEQSFRSLHSKDLSADRRRDD